MSRPLKGSGVFVTTPRVNGDKISTKKKGIGGNIVYIVRIFLEIYLWDVSYE